MSDVQRDGIDRRQFLHTASAAAIGASALGGGLIQAADSKPADPETIVAQLYKSMDERQLSTVCFDWDHMDPKRGLLRTRVSNNWHITSPTIGSDFFTKDQQEMIRAIFEATYKPEWLPSIEKQLKDDAGGYGKRQNIAIFGKPGEGKFEFVMTGRHMTIRCDGNSAEHMAFGGPIFYGHAAQGFNEKPDHPGNVYWPQALEANKVYEMLDGKQRAIALVGGQPYEQEVEFHGDKGGFDGIPVSELSGDQKEQVEKVLAKLLEPFRNADVEEVKKCLEAQGGIDKLHLAFYKDGDLGLDGVYDCWRLEGPAFVWYFRGEPHVHTWVHIADSPDVKLNA